MDDADKALERALQIDPRYARAHLQLGVLRKVQGRNDDAMMHFEEAIIHDQGRKVRREAESHLKRMQEDAD